MSRLLRAAFIGGLIGGAIDIIYACVVAWLVNGATPDRVLRFVGAGWVGLDAAKAGGIAIAALGLASHFAICIAFALTYCAVSLALPVLQRQALICGALYGVFIYLVMNYVVVPNSALAGIAKPPDGWRLVGELASHVLGVGLSISFAARLVLRRT